MCKTIATHALQAHRDPHAPWLPLPPHSHAEHAPVRCACGANKGIPVFLRCAYHNCCRVSRRTETCLHPEECTGRTTLEHRYEYPREVIGCLTVDVRDASEAPVVVDQPGEDAAAAAAAAADADAAVLPDPLLTFAGTRLVYHGIAPLESGWPCGTAWASLPAPPVVRPTGLASAALPSPAGQLSPQGVFWTTLPLGARQQWSQDRAESEAKADEANEAAE